MLTSLKSIACHRFVHSIIKMITFSLVLSQNLAILTNSFQSSLRCVDVNYPSNQLIETVSLSAFSIKVNMLKVSMFVKFIKTVALRQNAQK